MMMPTLLLTVAMVAISSSVRVFSIFSSFLLIFSPRLSMSSIPIDPIIIIIIITSEVTSVYKKQASSIVVPTKWQMIFVLIK
uniref:Putative secreted protein n=1 Tax=Anopheles darlingi TaxID=43151 RepID=A0A2M4DAB1_ANODA